MRFFSQNSIQEDRRTEKRKIGDIGENAVEAFLKNKGFVITDRNYNKKWGELDVVVQKGDTIHFVEVKTISREIENNVTKETNNSFSRESFRDSYRAEDNLHPEKLKRLSRVIQTYLSDKRLEKIDWQFDVATVEVDHLQKICRVSMLENVIL